MPRSVAAISVAERTGPSVEVECDSCGGRFLLSVRNEYRHRVAGTRPRCRTCRRPLVEMTPAERESYRRWWLEESGLSARELYEIAVGLGSPDE